MTHKRSHELYVRSFEKFLKHTDEKKVFLKEFDKYLATHKPRSLLDVGAGNGTLAVPIASKVEKYLAVEHNPKYAARLRREGLTVIEAPYPVAVKGQFDLVLMSHVISYEMENHIPLISNAWRSVAKHGHLLIVTHRGLSDDWSELLDVIGMGKLDKYEPIYEEIMAALYKRGEVNVKRIITTLEAANIPDMIEAMAFVAAAGNEELFDRFMNAQGPMEKLLESKYKTKSGYTFPFTHIFISVAKS